MEATANFWLSRAEYEADGKAHIKNVVAADEWAENVDDDAFTNGVAKVYKPQHKQRAYSNKLPIPIGETLASRLSFYQFADGVTKEHRTYNGENIKQADVNLLPYPLNLIRDPQQIKKDLEFYSVRVPRKTPCHDPSHFFIALCPFGGGR